ncbi:hypothetical protein [Schlesneria sp. T3-172]|uniref:hypothetical protein n=1 Tax=Schlesneria sphaerica TaxID=3373610 RepID=UPI0037CC3F25
MTTKRQVLMISLDLVAPESTQQTQVLVWPHEPDTETTCCRLLSSKITWMTCRAGDTVMLRWEPRGNWKKMTIAEVRLYRVFPTSWNGTVVESAHAWLEEGCGKI